MLIPPPAPLLPAADPLLPVEPLPVVLPLVDDALWLEVDWDALEVVKREEAAPA
jgi:hypothetical protein